MEKNERVLKLMMPNGGSGSISPRVSIPISWIKDMGITSEDRDLKVTYKNGVITIKKASNRGDLE